jgi:type I restriction enzyme, S subunit
MFREVTEKGFDLPLASVTKDGGVEFRADLDISVWNPLEDTSLYKRVMPGDFVIGLRSFQSGIGYSALEGLVSPAYTVMRPRRELESGYYRHMFKSSWFISRLENVAQGIRQGRTISAEDFYDLPLPVPDRAIQRAIADYLDAETARIDALIEKKRRMVELLDERRLAAVDWAFSADELRPCRLKHLLAQAPCYGVLVPQFVDKGIPFIRVNDLPAIDAGEMPEKMIEPSQSQEYRRTIVNEDDVLVSVVGSVDKVAVVSAANKSCNVARAVARLVPADGVPSRLLALWLQTNQYHDQALLATGGDTAQPTLNMSDLAQFDCYFPNEVEAEQLLAEIEAFLEPIQQAKRKLNAQLALLSEHRRALITAAVTGELAIPGVAA